MNENEFYLCIKENIKKHPKLIGVAINAITAGTSDRVEEERERAVDMEVLASVAFSLVSSKTRISQQAREAFENLALIKLEKYKDKTFTRWDWAVTDNKELLETKAELERIKEELDVYVREEAGEGY